MTNKEFFLSVLEDERPRFRKALEALPEDKQNHKVHAKSREAGSLAAQLAMQWASAAEIVTKGAPGMDFGKTLTAKADILKTFEQSMDQLIADVKAVSDSDWENGDAAMGDVWKAKKYWMVWGFLFDAIHHRGQLSTFLRAMGEKVPAIYGPSADDSNG